MRIGVCELDFFKIFFFNKSRTFQIQIFEKCGLLISNKITNILLLLSGDEENWKVNVMINEAFLIQCPQWVAESATL